MATLARRLVPLRQVRPGLQAHHTCNGTVLLEAFTVVSCCMSSCGKERICAVLVPAHGATPSHPPNLPIKPSA